MIDGNWLLDAEEERLKHMGIVRAAALGPMDMSANPFRVINRQKSVLYDGDTSIRHDVQTVAETAANETGFPAVDPIADLVEAIECSGLWASGTRFQTWVLGCNEYFRRITVEEDGTVRYRPVPPDYVRAVPDPAAPDRPIAVAEARLRRHPVDGKPVWTWDELDIRDPKNPTYRVVEHRDDDVPPADWTAHFLGGDFSGENYPYRWKDGTPFLPYVLYHKERLGDRLFDPYEGVELLRGSLTLAVLFAFLVHVIRDASWPQRWVANARPAGGEAADAGTAAARVEVVTDPATVLILESIEAGNQIMVGQWQAGGDPEKLEATVSAYAARLAVDADISPSDTERVGGNARSGYAISLTNEGKRQAQRRYRVQFQEADEELVAKTAAMLNRTTGTSYPEDGYSVLYKEIPLSAQEREARRRDLLELLTAGLIRPVHAYMELNPGLTELQAAADLKKIVVERRELIDVTPPPKALPGPTGRGAPTDTATSAASTGSAEE